jgi:ABC-type transport system involved in multi-copper enzyme maturation permease subunit
MNIVLSLIRNEFQKTWRSRWIVFVVLFGLFVLIAGGLYAYFVSQEHRWTPPPAVSWQSQLRDEINVNQRNIADLEQIKQQGQGRGTVRVGGRGGADLTLDQAIAEANQAIADDQYLIANSIAPVQSFAIAEASLFALGGIVMFLLIRIFGWLASEQIAGERSDRTITILLSRPASRNQVLFAKAVASFLISLVVVVLTLLIVYAMFSFWFGSPGSLTDQAGVAIDGAKPLGPGNLLQMPIWLFVLMCLGAAMLGVLCVQGMSLLISVLTGRWAAIGITLALLFGAPLVSTVIAGILFLISGSQDSSHFLNYFFFNVLAPVGSVAPTFGNTTAAAGSGINEFVAEVETLAVWTLGFFLAAWLLFRRKQEAG